MPEATALIADTVCEAARDGRRLADAIERARSVLGPDDVLPGVADVVTEVHVEAVFDDGSRLAVVSDPIGGGLAGDAPGALLPGPVHAEPEAVVRVTVTNTATVPVSVTSHFHFFEANPRLDFDRAAKLRMRLAVPAGSSVRFGPGSRRRSDWCRSAVSASPSASPTSSTDRWTRRAPARRRFAAPPPAAIWASGQMSRRAARAALTTSVTTAVTRRPTHEPPRGTPAEARRLTPYEYAATHGPRAGDRVRLGDSGLTIRVESDSQRYGDEFLAGFGKTARDGLHLKAAAVRDTCDVVISNVVVIDAAQGIRKVSIGIREGRICSIGRAKQPRHPSTAWTSSSAPAPRSCPARGSSPPPGRSTRTSISSHRASWRPRSPPG